MVRTLPLSEVKDHLSEVIDQVHREHDRVVVTRNGVPAAVLVSAEDLESLEETLALLSDHRAMRRIERARAAADSGDVMPAEELIEKLRRRR